MAPEEASAASRWRKEVVSRGRSVGLGLALLVDRIRSTGVGVAVWPGGTDEYAQHRVRTLEGH